MSEAAPAKNEETPLLRHSRSRSNAEYQSAAEHSRSSSYSSLNGEPDDEVTFPALTQVPSALSWDTQLNLAPTTSLRKHHDGDDHPVPLISPEAPRHDSRFIDVSPSQFWIIFSGIMLGYIIGFFDSTLMASSHPVITSYFNAANSASWLSTAFLLTSTAFMPLFGRTSDALGRKPVYLFSICTFFVTTAWCGLAQNIGSFIAARALCGVGAGGVMSMGQVISSDLVRLEYRGVYQSYLNLCLGIGSCTGLAFGGFLCDSIGWRNAFLIQLPFIFVYFILAAVTIPAKLGIKVVGTERMTVRQVIRNVDLTGSAFLILAVTALIMGLNLGGNVFPWTHPLVICSLILAFVLTIVLVRYERHVPRAVLPVEILTRNPRASILSGNFFGALSVNTMMFNAPLYFQAVKLASPTDSGLRLVAASIAVTVSSVGTGFLITWLKRMKPTIILGAISMVVGGCAAGLMGLHTSDSVAMICVSFSSLGQGFSFPSLMVSMLATSEQDDQAVATTTLGLVRNLGAVMGVSVSSWIFQNMLIWQLDDRVTGPGKDEVISLVRKSIRAISELDPLHQREVIEAYAMSLRLTFLSAAIWGLVMLILLSRIKLPRLGQKRGNGS
ncbi:hypothetical protein N7539_003744 [Penicillium diatomitis]|uniref:Major facilitator superfamily (MFS) profile domain-containing protein n=1 Tax=Penicillium diatomitis TaxID=2819901 RepID=A0A9W9XCN7_9EURO|nr:uncharacterized protein N7539_003744 [Penicillium diatomitis]KAJ5488854.1 hypothetical protein N7539_003744 [Penicillium diatomitis]